MPANSYPTLRRHLTEMRRGRFDDAVKAIEEAIAKGQIPNARLNEIRPRLASAIEAGWEGAILVPFIRPRDRGQDTEIEAFIAGLPLYPQLHTIEGMRRKLAAAPPAPVIDAIRGFLDEIAPLGVSYARARELAVKRQAAQKAPDALAPYEAPSASPGAMKMVFDILREVTREGRAAIARSIENRAGRMLADFLEKQDENVRAGNVQYSPYSWSRDRGHGKSDPIEIELIEACTDRAAGRLRIRKPDADALIQGIAERRAEEICRRFLEKNVIKLDSIIERKGDLASIEIVGRTFSPSSLEGRLKIVFADGSSFQANNSAVLSFTEFGRPYMRFPLTFHDVRMPDGTMMERPSEEKMNTEFIDLGRAAEVEHDTPSP